MQGIELRTSGKAASMFNPAMPLLLSHGLNPWLSLFRYEEEINRRTAAENEFVGVKKVRAGVDQNSFGSRREPEQSRALLWAGLASSLTVLGNV